MAVEFRLGGYREFVEIWFGLVGRPEGPLQGSEGWEQSEDRLLFRGILLWLRRRETLQ